MKLLPWEYGVRNMMRSPLRTILGAGGSMLVVLLVLAAGAFVQGMENSLNKSAQKSNVILMGSGSQDSLERSEISRSSINQAASIAGVKKTMGKEHISGEIIMMTLLRPELNSDEKYQVNLRGVTPAAFLVHPGISITDGRAPVAGQDELMIGKLALARLGGDKSRYAVGKKIYFDNRPWTISGHFQAPGTVLEAEVWMPLTDLQIASKRDGISAVFLTLDPQTGDYADVETFTGRRLDLELVSMPENEYYKKLSAFFKPVRIMIWVTAILIAAGGLFGGLNTMYASFASRVREMGSLQALGFSRRAIVLSILQESVLTASLGALVGSAIGLFVIDGIAVEFASGAFEMLVNGPVLASGIAAGIGLGIIGAIPPAIRCLAMPITQALKSH